MTIQELKNIVNDLVNKRDLSETYWITLKKENDVIWALVLAWCDNDFDNEADDKQFKLGTYRICGKIAFNNSYMKDYDIDWLLPWYKNGDVYDTEGSIESEETIVRNFSYWEQAWEEIKNNPELMNCMENDSE